MIEKIQNMETILVDYVYSRMSDLKEIDTCELGEATDMIKDLAEAAYYCSITK